MEEFSGAALGDSRLTKRLIRLVDDLAAHGEPTVARMGREARVLCLQDTTEPAGEKPIEWLRLTNEPVTTLDDAVRRIDWYRRRWLMEIFFRIVKSGCRVEALQLATVARLERALVIYLIIAWRILYLMTLGRDCPHLPCDVAFTPEEWRAAWLMAKRQPPPAAPPPWAR